MTRRELVRWLGLGVGVSLLAACQQAPQPGPAGKSQQSAPGAQPKASEVNIGAIFPISGEHARPGQTCLNAAQLAAEDINAAGGVKALGGARINLVSADLRSSDQVTRTESERVITANKLTAIVGAYASALSLVASEVTERHKMPFITASIADALVERGFKYIFQISPRASQFGEAQVKLASEVAGEQKKVAVVYENTAYGTATSRGVQEEAQKAGLEVVLFEAYDRNFTDASPLINKIRASGAQILFPVSYLNDMLLIIRTLKQQSLGVPVVAGGAGPLLPDFVQSMGDDANGVLSIASWNRDISDDALAADSRYQARYGEFLQEYAGEVYAMMWVLLDALERAASTDPEAVRGALAGTDITTGYGSMMPGGHVQFDERGWNKHAFPIGVQWQQGQLVTVYPKEVAKAPLIKAM